MEKILKTLQEHINRYGYAKINQEELDVLAELHNTNEKIIHYPHQYKRLVNIYNEQKKELELIEREIIAIKNNCKDNDTNVDLKNLIKRIEEYKNE